MTHDEMMQARKPAAEAIEIDRDIDTIQRVLVMGQDLGKQWEVGEVDIPRLCEGGMRAPLFALWVPGLDILGFDIVSVAKGYPVERNEQSHSPKTQAEVPLGFHHINQNAVNRCERLARNEEQGLLILSAQRQELLPLGLLVGC